MSYVIQLAVFKSPLHEVTQVYSISLQSLCHCVIVTRQHISKYTELPEEVVLLTHCQSRPQLQVAQNCWKCRICAVTPNKDYCNYLLTYLIKNFRIVEKCYYKGNFFPLRNIYTCQPNTSFQITEYFIMKLSEGKKLQESVSHRKAPHFLSAHVSSSFSLLMANE
jgi:hypothetical protein